jgi:predicted AAA+ superfamily ATPase
MPNYIRRTLHGPLKSIFTSGTQPQGLILAGIVGAGKTTLVKEIVSELGAQFPIFTFSGDSTRFRRAVAEDSLHILDEVRSQTTQPALVFIDEVQKSEAIFDAVKVAFDEGSLSFIASGSNPHYLHTIARQRLQRRATFFELSPLTLPEILASNGLIELDASIGFQNLLEDFDIASAAELVNTYKITVTEEFVRIINRYVGLGGLPLAVLNTNEHKALAEIRKVVERGFEASSSLMEGYEDSVRVYLAENHSREFGYQGIFQRTGLRKRDDINKVIETLLNQGYLLRKKPLVLEQDRRTYLTIYAYTDPGIVTYLSGETNIEKSKGSQVEGIVHNRIHHILQAFVTKASLHYFKPYSIGSDNKLKFLQGEIDFLLKHGQKLIPIEVKSAERANTIDTSLLARFVKEQRCKAGIMLYGGAPRWDSERKILFWPYWLV